MKEVENASFFMLLSAIIATPLALNVPSKILQALCGLSLFLILPGYGIISTFYATRLSSLERALASLCISIVLIPLVALILEAFSGDVTIIGLTASYLILLCIIFCNPIRLRLIKKPISYEHSANSKLPNKDLRLLWQGVPTTAYLIISYVLFFMSPRRFWDDEVGANLPVIKDAFSGDWSFIVRPFERPLVTWSLEVGHYFFGISEFSARAVFVALGGITILSTYLLATELFDEHTGWNASLILATLPSQIAWGGITRHAVIMTPFYVLSIHFFYKSAKQREPKFLYLSSICGIASYMASEMALLLIPTFVLYALISRSSGWFRSKHVIASISLFAAGYLVVQSIQRVPFDPPTYERFLQVISSEGLFWFVSKFFDTYFTFIFNSNPLLLLFGLIGLFIFLKSRGRAKLLCVIWFSVYILFLFGYLKVRSFYALPLLPALCIMAANCISDAFLKGQIRLKFFSNHAQNHRIAFALLALVLLLNLSGIPFAFSESRMIAPELWNAAYDTELFDFLRGETSPLDLILIQPSHLYLGSTTYLLYEPTFSFYLRRPAVQLDRLHPNPPYLPDFTLDYCRRAFGERNIYYVSVDREDYAYIWANFPSSYKVFDNKYTVQKLQSRNDHIIFYKSGRELVVQSQFLKITMRDNILVFYIWEPWPEGFYPGRLWHEVVRMRLPQELEISIDERLNESMSSGLIMANDRLKIESKDERNLFRMVVYSGKPIVDLEIENLDLANGSQPIGFSGEFVGNAVVTVDESTIRYITMNGMPFKRIERVVYSMDKESTIALGLASKFDQDLVFKTYDSAKLDCRNYPYFNMSINQGSLKRGTPCLRMAFLAGDSTIDSDRDGIPDVLQDSPPMGYKNRWATNDNFQTLARWEKEEDQ